MLVSMLRQSFGSRMMFFSLSFSSVQERYVAVNTIIVLILLFALPILCQVSAFHCSKYLLYIAPAWQKYTVDFKSIRLTHIFQTNLWEVFQDCVDWLHKTSFHMEMLVLNHSRCAFSVLVSLRCRIQLCHLRYLSRNLETFSFHCNRMTLSIWELRLRLTRMLQSEASWRL